jgi:hypothetical protein
LAVVIKQIGDAKPAGQAPEQKAETSESPAAEAAPQKITRKPALIKLLKRSGRGDGTKRENRRLRKMKRRPEAAQE